MKTSHHANPFGLLLNPEEVLRAVESSQPLGGLRSTVFRPLDRPNPGGNGSRSASQVDDDDSEDDAGPDAYGRA